MGADVIFALLLTQVLGAEPSPEVMYELRGDPGWGPEAGVITLTDTFRLASRGLDALGLEWQSQVSPTLGPWLRGLELVAIDLALASYQVMLPHELFGHGGRVAELGYSASYRFAPPLPYALLRPSGFSNQTLWAAPGGFVTVDGAALVTLGGFEVEGQQRDHVAFSVFRSRSLSHADALLLAALPAHQSFYSVAQLGDLEAHLLHLANRYGASIGQQRLLNILSNVATAIDPLLWASLYEVFYAQLFKGQRSIPLPTLRLGSVEAMASTRLSLVPWGREHQLDIFLGSERGNADVAVRIGEGPGGVSAGASVHLRDLRLNKHLQLVARLEAFVQPRLAVGLGPIVGASLVGGSAMLGFELLFGRWSLGLRGSLKTEGLVASQPYAATAGVSLTLGVRQAAP